MQKLIRGIGSSRHLKTELNAGTGEIVFLVTGKHFSDPAGHEFLEGIHLKQFVRSGANVEEAEVEEAYRDFVNSHAKYIVAIGGGSVMDLAKAIIYHCIQSSLPVPFFIAIPTTAGSGSEATHFAVVYKGNKKNSLVHPSLLPAVVILDAKLLSSLSSYQAAVSGMDALSQAIESYWNIHATAISRNFAKQAIRGWNHYFLKAVNEAGERAKDEMLWAAHLAGKAIDTTRTTGPHALSYWLTANHGIPHGQAVSLFLPVFFLYNNADTAICSLLGVKDKVEAMDHIQLTMRAAGLAIDLSSLGLDKSSIIPDLLNDVNEERFANNPVAFDREKLKDMIMEYL